ncbi:uncharacterized protein A4U43_C03F26690 [Asparagus officinalis]|uniref:RNase H type-1 domain-containing protein n=1 Tax=Asparagus officinalis TaxID=4686 RepID=A0A5P1FE13_ASPOF|nr:uncharacterized protein A4U43_C03F26690 [Asparagus officinalis]
MKKASLRTSLDYPGKGLVYDYEDKLIEDFLQSKMTSDTYIWKCAEASVSSLDAYKLLTGGELSDDVDCGIFMIEFINSIVEKRSITISEGDCAKYRAKFCAALFSSVKWDPPASGVVCINVNAAIDRNGSGCSSGIVARDHSGVALCSRGNYYINPFSPLIAEIIAIKDEVLLTKERKWNRWFIVSDCHNAMDLLSNPEVQSGVLDLLADEVRSLAVFSSFKGFNYKPRDSNGVAHLLAKKALGDHKAFDWDEGVSSVTFSAFMADMPSLC